MANVAKDFAQLISQSKSNKTGPYDTQATVKRVEGNTVWVSIPGGVDETPIDKTVNCSAGDKVQVRVSGGRAWITGNASAPPTDDKRANEAKTTAENAQVMAVDAKETAEAVESVAVNANTTAENAQHIAEGVNEHFWHDNTGAHVTEVTQEEWNDPADPNYHYGGNTLITTQGLAIRNGLVNLAEFGASGITIGQPTSGQCITVDPTAVTFNDNGWKYADISYSTGTVISDVPTNQKLKIGTSGFTLFDSNGDGLTVNGANITASGDITDGSGNVLSNKLEASSLVVDTDISIADNISVSSGQTSDGNTSIAKTGYTPLGVVGYRVVNASSSGLNGAFGVISHAYITGNTAYYRVRNTGNANMKVRIYFNILYVKS